MLKAMNNSATRIRERLPSMPQHAVSAMRKVTAKMATTGLVGFAFLRVRTQAEVLPQVVVSAKPLAFDEDLRRFIDVVVFFVLLVRVHCFEMVVVYLETVAFEQVERFDAPRTEVIRCHHAINICFLFHKSVSVWVSAGGMHECGSHFLARCLIRMV